MASKQAVIYTRISEDREGDGVAADRQERECRELAASLGLTVTHVYREQPISATKGKQRPEFQALLSARPPAILVWHQDRLLRVSADLEPVIRLDVPVHSVAGGSLDLATPQGRAVARTVAAWSTFEGEQKALRQRAENRQRIQDGWPVAGRPRWGFLGATGNKRSGNVSEHPVEGPQVRECFARFDAGEAVLVLAKDYNLSRLSIRRALSNRSYIGEVYHGGQWYPAHKDVARIVDPDLFERVQARLADGTRMPKRGNTISHLASGVAECGMCGAGLRAKSGTYLCSTSFAHVSIRQHMLDDLLCWEVFSHLAAEPVSVGGDLIPLEAQRAELEAERTELSGMLTAKGVDKRPVLARLAELDAEAQSVTERVLALRAEHVAAQVVAEIRAELATQEDDQAGADWWAQKWDQLTLSVQRELVRGLRVVVDSGRGVERVTVTPR